MTFEELKQSDIRIQPGEIQEYAEEFMKPEEIDHHGCSSDPAIFHDLYLKVTPVSALLVSKLTSHSLLKSFRSNIDGKRWYELPFCYTEKGENNGK